jgi:formylglycine-generating enzyme required for sulfatase activity
MTDIFISYAREDRSRVEPLAHALKDQGWSVWWDKRIAVGQLFEKIIEEALDDAKCIIVIWSAKSVNSEWVRTEAAEGLRRRILAPVFIEEANPPLRYRQLQTVSLVGWDGSTSHSGFKQLIQDLNSILSIPKPLEQELPKTLRNKIGMEFVLIPAGKFDMGSNLSPVDVLNEFGGELRYYRDEHPQHPVEITKPFYLQTTVLTQGQWNSVMENIPSSFKDCGDDCPVETVSWNDAQKFIDKLNQLEKTKNYRLPTEAEWEYACRSGTTTEFSFGDVLDELDEYAWHRDNSRMQSHPVGKKKPNVWGLYDMHGNVWEWCQDWYGDYPSNSVVDPKGAEKGKGRVLRGGSYCHLAKDLRSAKRRQSNTAFRKDYVGFRVARDL